MASASSTQLALPHWAQEPPAAKYHLPTNIAARSEPCFYEDELNCAIPNDAASRRSHDDNAMKLRKVWDGSGAVTGNIPQPSSRYGYDDWRTPLARFADLRREQDLDMQAKVMHGR